MRKRFTVFIVGLIGMVGLTIFGPTPAAQAGAFGLVINDLPSFYTVKVARFSVGSEGCATWNGNGPHNGVTYTCETRWLPAGRRSDKDDFGFWYDADGVMVQEAYEVYLESTRTFYRVSGFTWTRIHNNGTAHCYQSRGTWGYIHALCYVAT